MPKIEYAKDVAAYDAAMMWAPKATKLWAMVETNLALFHLHEIAAQSQASRLTTLVMGINDLAKEMRARQTPGR